MNLIRFFFDKIDEIEIKISNNIDFTSIISELNLKTVSVKNFRISSNSSDIEKKIFEIKNIEFDIFENKNDYVLYKINKSEERSPDLNDTELKDEIVELIHQKEKFEYNNELLQRIKKNEFGNNDFLKMGENIIQSQLIDSIKDFKKFEKNSVELLYSLPINSFTLINDEKGNIYLVKLEKIENPNLNDSANDLEEYALKYNTINKKSILETYDILLNKKYNVELNQKTIERVKNFFK